MKKPKILIVDDEQDVRTLVAFALKNEGYDLYFAENGAEGNVLFQEISPILIVLDLQMPVMTGLELLEKLRPSSNSPYIVLVLTGNGNDEEVNACYNLGIQGFIRKPCNLNELRGLIKQSIQLKQSQQALKEQQEEILLKNEDLLQAKQELEEKARALEITGKYKSEFLANMSHELRTPLNSLLLLTELLGQNKEGNLTGEQLKFVQSIHKSGKDLLNLIDDVLDLSKVEAGKMTIHLENITTKDLEDHVSMYFQNIAKKKGVQLLIQTGIASETGLCIDSQKVKQILNNLLSNAFKFTTKGAVTFRISETSPEELRTYHRDSTKRITLSVSDTGIGIDEKDQALIFEAFRQVDGSINRKFEGTGLGLSISKQFCEMLGGKLVVNSQLGQGSTFTLFLPTQPIASSADKFTMPEETIPPLFSGRHVSEHKSEPLRNEEVLKLDLHKNKVMIVDDDARSSFAVSTLLQKRNASVLQAFSGREAINSLEKHPDLDLILMDIMMPEIDGIETTRLIRKMEAFAKIPIVAITANADPQCKQDCFAAGMNDYLMKPIDSVKLLTIVQELLS
ncbi:response regulator [Deltaproteobacteria bacterium TL4]